MTNLAWLIYAAEVSQNITSCMGVVFVLATIVAILGAFVGWIISDDMDEYKERFMSPVRNVIILAIASFVIGSLAPTKKTVFMMVAVTYGDDLYKSDLREIVDPAKELLKKWINDQLQEKKK